ncbi:hypothetical protein TIFTF001_000522 [Ficus carica]|uniref:RRM domain-containing protein n=1 Tax=Ficus carica TaxID=3494 RepID=A0AA88CK29_FICCA|nr:hypothetical protein TIFTF001_000522 [Ficus carica]
MAKRLSLHFGLRIIVVHDKRTPEEVVFSFWKSARRLVLDSKTQRPKGFGFVTYESEVEAQKALKAMNGRIVDGRLIFVEISKTEKPGEKPTS